MDNDLLFVLGLVFSVLALPALVGAAIGSRVPRRAALLVVLGGGMIAIAVNARPGGYALAEIPDVVLRVVGRVLN